MVARNILLTGYGACLLMYNLERVLLTLILYNISRVWYGRDSEQLKESTGQCTRNGDWLFKHQKLSPLRRRSEVAATCDRSAFGVCTMRMCRESQTLRRMGMR